MLNGTESSASESGAPPCSCPHNLAKTPQIRANDEAVLVAPTTFVLNRLAIGIARNSQMPPGHATAFAYSSADLNRVPKRSCEASGHCNGLSF
jgi:hypothetical protein